MILLNARQHPKSHYRSIKYRSVSSDIQPNKINLNTQRLPVFQLNKPTTITNGTMRSKRPLHQSEQNIKNTNKSLFLSLSRAKQKQLDSTMISQFNPEDQFANALHPSSYIQSFEQEQMERQTKRLSYIKMGLVYHRLKLIREKSKADRISLPKIIQYQNSQFTALDPIRLPIQGVMQLIQKNKLQIATCPRQLKLIRCGMQQFGERNISQIQEFEKQYIQSMKRLRLKLSQNNVYQQSFLRGSRCQIKSLEEFIPQFQQQFQKTHSDQIQIQRAIFQTQPFQLVIKEQSKPQFEMSINSSVKVTKMYF